VTQTGRRLPLTRTKRTIVHFSTAFSLLGVDEMLPPGDYMIDRDEELIEGLSWLAYRHVATFIHLPAVSAKKGRINRMVKIDPDEFETALDDELKYTQSKRRDV
jgi:hypothetical protein